MEWLWLFLLLSAPALIVWLALSSFAIGGLIVAIRGRSGNRRVGAAVLLLCLSVAGPLLLRPEFEDARRSYRLAEIAALPRAPAPAPDTIPRVIHLHGFFTKDALRVAQAFDRVVIQQFADSAQIVTGETALECPGLVEHRADREYRVPCPDYVSLSLPERYLSLTAESAEEDKGIGILNVIRLSLVEAGEEHLIEAAAVENPRSHDIAGRLMDLAFTPREHSRICLGGEVWRGPVDPLWFLTKVLVEQAHADAGLCRI